MRELVSGWMDPGAVWGRRVGAPQWTPPRGPLPFLAVPDSGRCLEGEAGLVSGLVCPRGMLDPDETVAPPPCAVPAGLGARTPRSWVLSGGEGHFTVHRPFGLRL